MLVKAHRAIGFVWIILLAALLPEHYAQACATGIDGLVKCASGNCRLRQDNDTNTLAVAVAEAKLINACVGAEIDVYNVNGTPGGYTQVDHYFLVTAIPVTSAAQLKDDGLDVDNEQTAHIPIIFQTSSQQDLADFVQGNLSSVTSCTFPCE
jgi:hypothetical protein